MKYLGPIGVYSITCSVSGKLYIGSSSCGCFKRWWDHKKTLRTNTHHSILLQRAWNKYGEHSFVFAMVEITTADQAVVREQHYIDLFRSADKNHGFNVCPKAGSPRGRKVSDDAKTKMSIAQKNRPPRSEATRQKMRVAMTGKKMSPEAIEKTRQAHLGKTLSLEQRRAISERMKGWVIPPWHLEKLKEANAGRVVSEATRQKISAGNKGKIRTPEIIAKMTGRKRSQESRDRMAAAQRGKTQSAEQIAKRIATLKRTVALRNANKSRLKALGPS